MSVWIDKKYMDIVARYLDLPVRKSSNQIIARCPVCGDSSKSAYKRRFGISVKPDGAVCGCFNCGYAAPLWKFLNEYYPDVYKDYQVESFLEHKEDVKKTAVNPTTTIRTTKLFAPTKKDMTKLIKAANDDQGRAYLEYRRIGQKWWKYFFITHDFKQFMTDVGYKDAEQLEPVKRIVVPLIVDGKIIGYQGRSFDDKSKRYVNIKLTDSELIFIPPDLKQDVFVFEGIYDAMMVDSSVASLSSNLLRVTNFIKNKNPIFCFDNEPDNRQLIKQIERVVRSKHDVFLPFDMSEKDLNSWVINNPEKDPESYIRSNTYSWPLSLMKFNEWKNV